MVQGNNRSLIMFELAKLFFSHFKKYEMSATNVPISAFVALFRGQCNVSEERGPKANKGH